ncbi:hypothetical protein niasHT_000158 [Heterodera trifolii]|uniref:B30.2/SPRY domain-containing protein n=1 Tax=Heterodera trifolii TaxID=157864 RepID=A0ABD2LQ98_9BILA
MSLLFARIGELNRAKTIEPSVASSSEVDDDGTSSSFSDGNSRKSAIADRRKIKKLSILTVVNITVTVAVIIFFTTENARISSELEFLKKFVGKMEQQHRNDGQQTEFCTKMDSSIKDMIKAIETKLNELVEQQKKEEIFIGVLKDRFGKAGEQKLSKLQNDQKGLLEKISELEKQQKEQIKATADQSDQLSKILEKTSEMKKKQKQQHEENTTKDDQQTEFYSKMDSSVKDMIKVIETKIIALEEHKKNEEIFIGLLKDRFGKELLKAVHPNIRKNIAEKFSYPKQNCWDANASHNDLEVFGTKSLKVYYKGDGSGRRSVFAKHSILFTESGIFFFEIKIKSCKSLCSIGLATKVMPLDGKLGQNLDTCAYQSDGQFWANGPSNTGNANFSSGDIVGCGINLATRRIIFTKNGQPLNTPDLFFSPPFGFPLFPFISLSDSGDLIETNFGPKFKFDPAKVQQQATSNFLQNYWDANSCHENLEIIGNKSLVVNYKKNAYGSWRSVFAKYSILLNKDSSNIFYYEILVKNQNYWFISFGFAVKQKTKLDGIILYEKGIYVYESDGEIWGNGKEKGTNYEYSYGVGDTVGMGINLATRQLFFTKNGLRLDFSDLLVDPSFADDSFHPFLTLGHSDDKIEANFGPNFKFDLATLSNNIHEI